MTSARRFQAAAVLICVVAAPLRAATPHDFAIAAGRLDSALTTLAQQAGIDVGTTDPGLMHRPSRALRGRMSARAALDRLLAGSGYHAIAIDAATFRIVRDPPVRSSPPPPPPPIVTPPAPATIIVTASKRDATLLRFPGSVSVVAIDGTGAAPTADMHDLATGMPILQTTQLGDGRNKLFVRGVADSSFVGTTRSTASVYFGDVPLGYGGPDPNLNLYDVARVEILEGPQGALYGAGSIGGIIRLTPKPPALDRLAASATASIAATQGGGAGYDLAGMVNIPIVTDLLAVRAVGYRTSDGGYINDVRRGLHDINRVETSGGRAALRIAPGDDWTIDLGLVGQTISAPDSQYVERGLPGLSRASAIAQPFEDDFLLGRAVVTKNWSGGVRLVSATGLVSHHSDDRYDATTAAAPDVPLAYDSHDRNLLFSHETRLSRTAADGSGWVIGGSLLKDHGRIEREFGPPGDPQQIVGVSNRATDLSGFAEATLALGRRLTLTGGGRLTWTRTDGDPSFTPSDSKFIRGRGTVRVSPTLAADWLVAPDLAWFARYGSGFRTGGLAVAPGVGRVANYSPDTIRVAETGLRLERHGTRGLTASASLSYARWTKIQADLIDSAGFPYTTNIGTGEIIGLEAIADWVPIAGFHLAASMFLNHSELIQPITVLSPQQGDMLPDTPRFAATATASYQWEIANQGKLHVAATARYTGRSVVGVGPELDLAQGRYAVVDTSAGWSHRPVGVTIRVDNVANTRGNRFSAGNPFGLAARNEETPLRPRTIRLTMTYGL